MSRLRLAWLLCSLLTLWAAAGSASAMDYRSVGVAPAILYDAPTERGRKLALAPRNMPLEVLQSSGSFTRVRDASGEYSWIATRDLVPRRHVVVITPTARVHQGADEASPLVFAAERHVLMELIEPPANGWVKVRHQDGQIGFAKAADVWGD